MKKFLVILLIAVVACSTISVADQEVDLQKVPDWIKNGWAKIKSAFKKVVTFLKDNGLWDPLVKVFAQYGKKFAKDMCMKAYDDEKFCDELVNQALPKVDENGEVQLKGLFNWAKKAWGKVKAFWDKVKGPVKKVAEVIGVIFPPAKPVIDIIFPPQ